MPPWRKSKDLLGLSRRREPAVRGDMRGESEQPAKGRRHRATRPKAPKAPARLSNSNLQEQLDHRTRERDEALEQLTATSDVLQVISQSTFDLQSVLLTLVRAAGQLCQAENVQIF